MKRYQEYLKEIEHSNYEKNFQAKDGKNKSMFIVNDKNKNLG